MTRKEERAQLSELLDSLPLFGLNHYEKVKIITAMLDGGYRYNPTVLREAADNMRDSAPALPVGWLRRRANTMEDFLS